MDFISLAALLIHRPGIPVAATGDALRPPVRPDAELGVPEPFGALVMFEGFGRGLKGTGGDADRHGPVFPGIGNVIQRRGRRPGFADLSQPGHHVVIHQPVPVGGTVELKNRVALIKRDELFIHNPLDGFH